MTVSCVCSRILMAGSALLFLAATAAHAQDPIGQPLSGSIGTSIYSESAQTGPSASLLQGGGKLTSSYLRTGTSDPLSFLIESGFMSPYAPEGALISSYANAAVADQIVNDSTVAERFSDYRNNGELMSGAGSRSTLATRAATAGSTGSARSGTGAGTQFSGAFAGLTMRAPFAAGSSALAAGQAGAMGSNSFVDPNAYLAAASSSPALADMQAGSAAGSSPDSTSNSLAASAPEMQTFAYGATDLGVPPPTGTAYGPAPGDVFPDTSIASPAANGFPDSTMGTAGLSTSASESPFSRPLLVGMGERGNPFPSISEETSSFLHPSLLTSGSSGVAAPGGAAPGAENGGPSISEVARRLRLHAMIYNPGAMPSAFQQKAMSRDYERNKRQPHRPTSLTAPSVTH